MRTATLTTPYDASGQPQTATLTSYYFGGAYETRSDGTTIKYYSFNGQAIAMNDGTGLQYFLTDHLGSIVAVTDDEGTLITQQRYLPFGGQRTDIGAITQTDFGYTGQRKLDSGMGGLMDYKARFYSPYINHFLQPDSLIPDPSNPQAWNRYSYVKNNPVNFNDPTGHFACGDGETKKCGTGKTQDPNKNPHPKWSPGKKGKGDGGDDGKGRHGLHDTIESSTTPFYEPFVQTCTLCDYPPFSQDPDDPDYIPNGPAITAPNPPSHTGWVFGYGNSWNEGAVTMHSQGGGWEYIHAYDDGTSAWHTTYSDGSAFGESGPWAVYYGMAYGVTTASDEVGSSTYYSGTLAIIQFTFTNNPDAGSGTFTVGISPGLAFSSGTTTTY